MIIQPTRSKLVKGTYTIIMVGLIIKIASGKSIWGVFGDQAEQEEHSQLRHGQYIAIESTRLYLSAVIAQGKSLDQRIWPQEGRISKAFEKMRSCRQGSTVIGNRS